MRPSRSPLPPASLPQEEQQGSHCNDHAASICCTLQSLSRRRRPRPTALFLLLTTTIALSSPTAVTAAVASYNPEQLPSAIIKAEASTKILNQRTPTRKTATPSPTPTIPPQCQDCWGVNNTSGMTCYQNTQCVLTSMLCSDTSPCTDDDGDQDPGDPILCQDQLCVGANFLPVPSPGSGKLSRSTTDCWPGNYYSLFGETPKYTQSCVQDYVSVPTNCQPWEYLAQSSCFLSTCKDDTYCETPFSCVKRNPSDAYGICSNNGTQSGVDDSPASGGGGSTAQYSAKEYLVQGLLIGICSLALGVGLGVGFWHYRNKRRRIRQWTDTTDLSTEDADGTPGATATRQAFATAAKGSDSIFWTVLLCGRTRKQSGGEPAVDNLAAYTDNRRSNNNSNNVEGDPESREGSLVLERRSSRLPPNRWRWASGEHRIMSAVPEFEPPPMYRNEPALPTYGDSTEDIALTSVHHEGSVSNQSQTEDVVPGQTSTPRTVESRDPTATNPSETESGSQDLVSLPIATRTTHSRPSTAAHDQDNAALRSGPPPLMPVEVSRNPTPAPPSPARSKPSPEDDPSSQTSSSPKSEK